MSKRIVTLGFMTAAAALVAAWLSGAAQAGPPNICGNGVLEGPEVCDDGNTANNDGCDENCFAEVCGNGVTQGHLGETCDDGNTVACDNCDAACHVECGDNELECAEQCDDGNLVDGDGCDSNCTNTGCGNGITTPPEQCDDGNTIDNDACSNACTFNTDPLDPKEQACVNAVNKNWAGVLKAQGKDDSTCVKNIAKGSATSACIGSDAAGKVQKAKDKTTATAGGSKCTGEGDTTQSDDFAFEGATAVNMAAMDEALEAFDEVYGDPPNIVTKAADAAGAACQGEVAKQLAKLQDTCAKEANKAKKSALKGGKGGNPPPVPGRPELADAIDMALAASTKIAGAESKANTGIAKKCTDGQVDALFDCDGATTANGLTLCVIAAAKEACCNALEAADGIDLDCPEFPPTP
jgi:cysteine-rich repeat protein